MCPRKEKNGEAKGFPIPPQSGITFHPVSSKINLIIRKRFSLLLFLLFFFFFFIPYFDF